MKNLDEFGVVELKQEELMEVEGGVGPLFWFAVGVGLAWLWNKL